MIKSLSKSPALRAAGAMGFSGLALAVGNLLLARVLAPSEFARFTLFYAITQIGMNIGPLGADVIMTRQHFDPDAALLRQVLKHSTIVAVLLAAMSLVVYQFGLDLVLLLVIAIIAGSIKVVPTSYLRSQQRFGQALLLTMSTNASVLVAAAAATLARSGTTRLPAGAMVLALVITAIAGTRAVAGAPGKAVAATASYPMADALAAVSFIAAGMIMSSLDRLITPKLMGLPALATLSVLTTIAGSPFHMLHLGIGYTLVPGLRNASDRAARTRVLLHEGWIIAGACLISAVGIWIVTPFVLRFVLNSRYDIARPLLIAAICLGLLKVLGSLCAAAINALGSSADLTRLSIAGWVAIAVATLGGCIGAAYGLTGIVYGVTVGWLARALSLAVMARRVVFADRLPSPTATATNSKAWE